MNEEKIKEVFSDEEFVKSLMELETPEEVQEALEEKDIDMSIAEIKQIANMLQKKADGELSEDELENVAGGTGGTCEIIYYETHKKQIEEHNKAMESYASRDW